MDNIVLLLIAAIIRFLVAHMKAGNLHLLFLLRMKHPSAPSIDDDNDDSSASKDKLRSSAETSLSGLISVDVDDEKKRAADIVTQMASDPFEFVVLYGVGKRTVVQHRQMPSYAAHRRTLKQTDGNDLKQ